MLVYVLLCTINGMHGCRLAVYLRTYSNPLSIVACLYLRTYACMYIVTGD